MWLPSRSSSASPTAAALMQWDSPGWAAPCQEQREDRGPGYWLFRDQAVIICFGGRLLNDF